MACTFTTDQVAAMMLDYTHFARLVCGLQPDPWQSDVLLCPRRPTLLCCSRQVGKSETVAVLVAASICFRPGYSVLVLSTGREHAHYLLDRIRRHITAAEERGLCRVAGDSAARIELASGSTASVVAATPRAVRGYSPDLLVVDEAAHIADIAGETASVLDSALPALSATGGVPILLSTPNGRVGRFAGLWHSDDPYWHRIEVSWQQCPRLHGPIIESLRRSMPQAVFAQEYECSFVTSGSQLFDWDALLSATGGDDEPLQPECADEPDTVVPMFDVARLRSIATRGQSR